MSDDVKSDGDAGAGLMDRVIKQIEYYFGDINLMKDRFLKEKIQEDDGWVTIETMLKFNRLKQITEDEKFICEALKKSTSGLMEVSEDGAKIRRSPSKPLPGDTKERRDEIANRTVYTKVFPLDSKLDDLMEFFETYGPVETVFMKRDFHKKTFKGSVFVTFSTKEDAEKFLKEEGTKYKDQVLEAKLFKTSVGTFTMQMNPSDILIALLGLAPNTLVLTFNFHRLLTLGRTDYFKEKQALKKKNKGQSDKSEEKSKEEASKETEEDLEEKAKQQMTKNAVLHLKGMHPETNREEIKKFFSSYGDVGWVDFDKGVTEGYLRLREPNSAGPTLEKAKEANDGKIVLHDTEVEVRVVEGDEELEYWKKMFKDIADKHGKKKGGRDRRQGGGRGQRGGRRNRGGPQGKRKQRQRKDEDDDDDDGDSDGADNGDEPPAKAKKTEVD